MKKLITLLICSITFISSAIADEKVKSHPIPLDSLSEWDYRGDIRNKHGLPDTAAVRKLAQCKTYEELRDALKVVIAEEYTKESQATL